MAYVEGARVQNLSSKKLPDFLQNVNLKYVKMGYHYLVTRFLPLLLLPVLASTVFEAGQWSPDHVDLHHVWITLQLYPVSTIIFSSLLVLAGVRYIVFRPRPIYLVDFTCHKPRVHDVGVPFAPFMERCKLYGYYNERSLEFQKLILERSGLGEETYLPQALHLMPPQPTLAAAREEAEDVMFGAVDTLFCSTGINPNDISILIVNCSLFNPTPSLSAMVVNKYKLRSNIRSYNLGGMGCSASLIAVNLAHDLLQVHKNTYALIISTENITQNWYTGNRRSMLIPNCLFRVGGAAMLLSNKRSDRWRAKYQLQHIVRTHIGADDRAFKSVYQQQDEEGKLGVSLSKELMEVAGESLKTNIVTLGPKVLPLSEKLLFAMNVVARKLLKMKVKPYVPDFKLAFEHFCIHAGGRAVIDALEKNLKLSEKDVEASRMALHRFGNTSSSSIWYELSYLEAKNRMKRGDRVWQISFGSGFKCNSAVWLALRTIKPSAESAWADRIGLTYPVDIPEVHKF